MCSFSTSCRHHLVVEHDGSVYPCDFHVRPDLCLGNVLRDSFEQMTSSRTYEAFAGAKAANLPEACRECQYVAFCNGDCPRSGQSLCAGWKRFFAHSLDRLRTLAAEAALGTGPW
jgi:uncharacterized protein